MENGIKDLFCELCSLEFEKKVWYDIHLKFTHGTEIIKIKEEKLFPCETEARPRNINKSLQNKLDDPFTKELESKNIPGSVEKLLRICFTLFI